MESGEKLGSATFQNIFMEMNAIYNEVERTLKKSNFANEHLEENFKQNQNRFDGHSLFFSLERFKGMSI